MTDDLSHGQNPPAPTNPLAVVSVIAGLLLCIPGTGVIAIPTGIIGLKKSGRIDNIGRVPSLLGLVLGIINLLWWTALIAGAYGTYRTYTLSRPAIENHRIFIRALSTGNITDAKSLCTDAIDEGKLTDSFEQIQKLGLIESVNADWGGKYHGPNDIEVTAEVKFEKFSKMITGHWMTTDAGPKLTAYELRDPPTTQPTDAATSRPN